MWVFYIIGFSMIVSLCIASYWLYKSFKCSKMAQYSCENERCLLKHSCSGHKPTSDEAKKIRELLKRMDEEEDCKE